MVNKDKFNAIVASAGFTLDEAEKERLMEGYAGLQTLLARIPDMPLAPDEPAIAYIMPSTWVRR